MRSAASLASVLAGTAAVVSSQDHHVGLPFYVGLAVMGLVNAWAVNALHEDRRRWVAIGSALVWAHAAGWVAVLLVFPFQASSPHRSQTKPSWASP